MDDFPALEAYIIERYGGVHSISAKNDDFFPEQGISDFSVLAIYITWGAFKNTQSKNIFRNCFRYNML
jgi:hypothetical protein